MNAAAPKKPFELTGRHVLMMLVAFFVTVFSVEALFITAAVQTHTGMVSKQPYRKGLNYGERIEQSKRQEKLGWVETLTVSRADHTLTLQIKDQYTKPVSGLHISAKIGRPTTDAEDRALSFDATGEGTYKATMSKDMIGAYIADFQASDGAADGDIVWRLRKRVWLKP